MAYRVPVITGSVTDLTVKLTKNASLADVNEAYREASMKGSLHHILGYSDEPLVSVDYIGNPNSCTIDSLATSAVGDGFVKVVGWYDNEWGYSSRTADLANFMVEKGI
jgi:glyceraldehyde 3-phosphate dehydrogenase